MFMTYEEALEVVKNGGYVRRNSFLLEPGAALGLLGDRIRVLHSGQGIKLPCCDSAWDPLPGDAEADDWEEVDSPWDVQ